MTDGLADDVPDTSHLRGAFKDAVADGLEKHFGCAEDFDAVKGVCLCVSNNSDLYRERQIPSLSDLISVISRNYGYGELSSLDKCLVAAILADARAAFSEWDSYYEALEADKRKQSCIEDQARLNALLREKGLISGTPKLGIVD